MNEIKSIRHKLKNHHDKYKTLPSSEELKNRPMKTNKTMNLPNSIKTILKHIKLNNNMITLLIVLLVMINNVNAKPITNENQNKNNIVDTTSSDYNEEETLPSGENKQSSDSKGVKGSSRNSKSLFFSNPINDYYFNNAYQNDEMLLNSDDYDNGNNEEELLGRSRPTGSNNKKKYPDSPIYYIKMPPNPYVHVPGYGYISDAANLKPPPSVLPNENTNNYNQKPNKHGSNNHNQNQNNYNQNNNNNNYMSPQSNLQNFMTNMLGTQSYMSQPPPPPPPQQQQQQQNVPNYLSGSTPSLPNYMNLIPNQIAQQSQNMPNYNSMLPNYLNQMTPTLNYQTDQNNMNNLYPASTYPLNNFNPNVNFNGGGNNFNGMFDFGNKFAHDKYQNSPVYNLPLEFLANGKPTNIYTLPNEIENPISKPIINNNQPNIPDSTIYNLDKGPYYFNGKPNDMYVLRDTFNMLYDEALNNFYP